MFYVEKELLVLQKFEQRESRRVESQFDQAQAQSLINLSGLIFLIYQWYVPMSYTDLHGVSLSS